MSQQFSPSRSQTGGFAQQQQQTQPLSPSAAAQQPIYNGGATAVLYGPPLSRTRASDAAEIAAHRAEYDARLAELDRARSEAERAELAAQWDRQQRLQGPGLHGGHPRTAFYNTTEGADLIAAARRDLSARAKPVDRDTHRSTVQDNGQRAYHAECVLGPSTTSKRGRVHLESAVPALCDSLTLSVCCSRSLSFSALYACRTKSRKSSSERRRRVHPVPSRRVQSFQPGRSHLVRS